MAEICTIQIGIDPDSREGMKQSFAALAEVLNRGLPDTVAQAFPRMVERDGTGRFRLRAEVGDLLVREALFTVMAGACEAVRIKILPPDWFCEFMTSIAAQSGGWYRLSWPHGWPVLSTFAPWPDAVAFETRAFPIEEVAPVWMGYDAGAADA